MQKNNAYTFVRVKEGMQVRDLLPIVEKKYQLYLNTNNVEFDKDDQDQ